MKFKDRIVELRRVKASELRPHPENWRRHSDKQRAVLAAILEEVGFAGAVLTRLEDDGGLQIIDGHERKELAQDEEVPALVTDLTEEEARKILATFDSIGAMAETDHDALRGLVDSLEFGAADLKAFAKDLVPTRERPPDRFKEPNESTDQECPKCGYKWSG